MTHKILLGDCFEQLKQMESQSVNCIITSPPYYGLRDYGTAKWVGGDPNCPHYRTSKSSEKTATGHKAMMEKGEAVGDAIYKTVCPICGAVRVDKQIGLEETPKEFIDNLVNVFHECKRVLKDDGTLWLNIGDSYCGTGDKVDYKDPKYADGRNGQSISLTKNVKGCKIKDLIGIPWMLAFALRNDGWYLRQDIIWHKPNPMPESVKDRCTKSHEYIFLLTKKPHYYFDYEAIQEPIKDSTKKRLSQDIEGQSGSYTPSKCNGNMKAVGKYKSADQEASVRLGKNSNGMRNKRDVWSVTTKPFKGAHFATFPEDLIEPCVLAGSPVGGVVLDPFCGSGTTGVVAVRNEMEFIGIELNQDYLDMAEKRIGKEEKQGIQISLF